MRALPRRGAHRPAPAPAPVPAAGAAPQPPARLSFEDVTLDPRTRRVTRAGRLLELTKTEYA